MKASVAYAKKNVKLHFSMASIFLYIYKNLKLRCLKKNLDHTYVQALKKEKVIHNYFEKKYFFLLQ